MYLLIKYFVFVEKQYYQYRLGRRARRAGSSVYEEQIRRFSWHAGATTCCLFAHVDMHTSQLNKTPFNDAPGALFWSKLENIVL